MTRFDFDGRETSLKSWNRGNKREETNQVNSQVVKNMTGYKKLNSREAVCWQQRLGRASPICKKQYPQIVAQFQTDSHQHKIVSSVKMSLSAINNIIKGF